MQHEEDILLHGKWSEEAKQRVRQARKAGRSVYDMFGDLYNKAAKATDRGIRRLSDNTVYSKETKILRRKQADLRALNRAKNDIREGKDKQFTEAVKHDPATASKRIIRNRNDLESTKNAAKRIISKKRSRSTFKVLSDLAGYEAKKASKAMGRAGKELGKFTDNVAKSTKRGLRNFDKEITKRVNKSYEEKDRATLTKAERAQIQNELKRNKAHEKRIAKYKKEAPHGNSGWFKRTFDEKGANKQEKKARQKSDKLWSEATAKAQENTVNKSRYKNTGDFIEDKTVGAVKRTLRSAKKKFDKWNTNDGKGVYSDKYDDRKLVRKDKSGKEYYDVTTQQDMYKTKTDRLLRRNKVSERILGRHSYTDSRKVKPSVDLNDITKSKKKKKKNNVKG